MTDTTKVHRYPVAMISLHWLTFLLVVLAYIFMEFRDIYPRGSSSREFMKATHYSLGLTVLGLTIARLLLKVRSGPAPAIAPAPAPWQNTAAKIGHTLIYIFLLCMPVIGWSALSADGGPVLFYGFEIPCLLEPSKILSGQLEEIHEIGANIGFLLLGGHALFAIVHHAVFKDTTLIRMMPSRAAP